MILGVYSGAVTAARSCSVSSPPGPFIFWGLDSFLRSLSDTPVLPLTRIVTS